MVEEKHSLQVETKEVGNKLVSFVSLEEVTCRLKRLRRSMWLKLSEQTEQSER